MNTPICDFVKAYAESDSLRLHMPAHKGQGTLGIEPLDITEIDGADVLYRPRGIIKQSEDYATALFGSAKTVYSAEGSSLSIRAMLYLATLHAKAEKKPLRIAAGRNAHKAFFSAVALLDWDVAWLPSDAENGMLSCAVTASSLDAFLRSTEQPPSAVYVTSPDYLGNTVDIAALAEVCHRYGILLLVDNAHGAYLRFLPTSRHPITLGADMCCDSAHKTLPVLTGGAYLHVSDVAPARCREQAENAMAIFASTSPSYLILQSLDAANRYLSDGYPQHLADFIRILSALKTRLSQRGFTLIGDEPLKLTIAPKPFGYTGQELAALLQKQGLVCEFADPDFTVMMLAPEIGACGIERLENALCAVARKPAITTAPPPLPTSVKVTSVRDALLSPSRELPIERCIGRVLADAAVTCPPAVSVVACGERIDEAAIRCFAYYGISSCRVMEDDEET